MTFSIIGDFHEENSFYDRNKALITSRCSLNYKTDKYQSVTEHSHLLVPKMYYCGFLNTVLWYLWRLIKQSDLCCCVSKFYCSSSTTLEKCEENCCGKCKKDRFEENSSSPELDSDTEVTTDTESQSGSNSEKNSSLCESNSPNDDSF